MTAATGGGDVVGTKSPVKIFANIFISFIGAGVLGLPYAFKEAGILEGMFIMTVVGCISVKAMLLIVDCKHKLIEKNPSLGESSLVNGATNLIVKIVKGKPEEKESLVSGEDGEVAIVSKEEPSKPPAPGQDLTYGDVGYYAIGNIGRLLVDLSILISQIGFCCAYLIFISENLSDYIHGLKLGHWLLILLPPLGCLCLLRHLSSLAISSLFAQMSNLLAFAVVFWFDFEHFYKIEMHPKKISLEGFPFFLAVAIYCYEGAGMILSLESSLAKEVRQNFKFYFKGTLVIVTLLYISFGSCGYLSFGPETNAIITLNLPKGQSLDFAIMVKSCLCLALFFTYPVMMFPVIKLMEKKFISDPEEHIWKGNLLRFVMVALTGLVVLAVPNFANLISLVGSTCCTMLAFTLPGLFHLQIYKGSLSRCDLCLDVFLVFLGVVGAITGTMDALVRLRDTHLGIEDEDVAGLLETSTASVANITESLFNSTVSHVVTALNKTLSQNIGKH